MTSAARYLALAELLPIIILYLSCRKPKLQGQVTANITVRQTSKYCVNQKVFKRCLKVATDDR